MIIEGALKDSKEEKMRKIIFGLERKRLTEGKKERKKDNEGKERENK